MTLCIDKKMVKTYNKSTEGSSHANVLNRKSKTLMIACAFSVFLILNADAVEQCDLLFRGGETNAAN
mgnify:CR=1 FL=1